MTIATTTTPIEIPFPAGAAAHLRIAATACRLHVEPGTDTGEPWIQGSYTDPSGKIPLRIEQDEDGAELLIGTDVSELVGLLDGPPQLFLRLGRGRPFALTIEAGASEMQLELGGTPISRLTVSEGAGKT